MTAEDRALLTSLEVRLAVLEDTVASAVSTRQDLDRLTSVVREVQLELARIPRDLPGAVEDLRARLGKVEEAIAEQGKRFTKLEEAIDGRVEHGVRVGGLTQRVATLERRMLLGLGLAELVRAVLDRM